MVRQAWIMPPHRVTVSHDTGLVASQQVMRGASVFGGHIC
jgi:hypothetical protein